MKTTNRTAEETFTSSVWSDHINSLTEAFRLTPEESQILARSKTARLIAALPYLAGCEQADRTALAHVSVYLLASRGSSRWVFDHTPADDAQVARRLATIADFQGGEAAILKRGMQLLELQMICGYARDQAKDLVSGEYNPLLSHVWNARPLMDALIRDIVDTKCPEMDALFNLDDAQWTWWL